MEGIINTIIFIVNFYFYGNFNTNFNRHMNTRFWVVYWIFFPDNVEKPEYLLLQLPSFLLNPLFTKTNWHGIMSSDYIIEKYNNRILK